MLSRLYGLSIIVWPIHRHTSKMEITKAGLVLLAAGYYYSLIRVTCGAFIVTTVSTQITGMPRLIVLAGINDTVTRDFYPIQG